MTHATALDVSGARVEGPSLLAFEDGLFEGAGSVESPLVWAPPFDRLVGSWNAELPSGSGLRLEVQVQDGKKSSGWYGLGKSEAGVGSSLGEQEDEWGKVNVDTLELKQPATAFRYRVLMTGEARLRRVSFAHWDSRGEAAPLKPFKPGPWVRELKLRPRSQMEEQSNYRRDICSPTSLSMLLDFWGRRLKTISVADGVRDRGSGLFGNWTLNVAYAAMHGLRGRVARMDSMEELQEEIAAGRPVVVTIAFEPGELQGAPIRRTPGHLLVVAGFTRKGEVVAYDPAAPSRLTVRRVYPREDFYLAWLKRKRGVAYVLGPAFPETAYAGTTADLRREPEDGSELLSQLLPAERLRLLEARGHWVKAEALEQPAFLPTRRWHGITGWTRADALTFNRPEAAPPADGATAPAVLKSAKSFLGKPYLWGGRSERGVDCSGLVGLAYRSAGLRLPRDAHEQFLKASPIRRKGLEPGDLVFLTKPGSPKSVSHVLLYEGGENLLESRKSAGRVLRTSFKERFGLGLEEIESGQSVDDLTESPTVKRRIYFGSFLHE